MWKVRRCRWSKLQHIHLISITESHSYQCPRKTALTPTQAPTATSTMWLQLASYHDTFWLLHIHGSMQCTAELPQCAGHALRCCWHTFVYPHQLQNHKITAIFDVQRPFRTKDFPVLLRSTTKLAQSTSKYYFVLQSSHTVIPSTTSYCKARTKYFPILLRTTKLAHSNSQNYLVLQSWHKVRPSTTSYYKACTKHVPVPLRTTKLAQSTSQY